MYPVNGVPEPTRFGSNASVPRGAGTGSGFGGGPAGESSQPDVRGHGLEGEAGVFLHAREGIEGVKASLGAQQDIAEDCDQKQTDGHGDHQLDEGEASWRRVGRWAGCGGIHRVVWVVNVTVRSDWKPSVQRTQMVATPSPCTVTLP